MREPVNERAVYDGPALFSYGLRPFFFGAALFAGLAVPVWVLLLTHFGSAGLFFPVRAWHVHEMVFGFLPAVITGFVLTAIPNWTDRPPIRGRELMLLWSLWVAGRVAMAVPWLPSVLCALVDGAFLVAAASLVWREIAAGRSWSHAPIGVLITLYAGAGLSYHGLTLSGAATDRAERMALGLVMLLLAIIGGRVTPNFTEEFLTDRNVTRRVPPFSWFDGLSVALVGLAVANWIAQPDARVTGWMFVAAGVANLGRLVRWHGWATWPEPLVLILHIGYGWFAAALVIVGGAILDVGLPTTDALHAFTTGAVGVMTLAVMTRASLGHTGRIRHAGPMTVGIYLLVNLGALLRVFGPATTFPDPVVLALAGACWSGAYLLFAFLYGPFLLRPSLDE